MAGPDVLVLHHAASFDDVWHVYESLKATQLTAPGARAEKGKDVRSDIILLANGAVSEKHQRHLEENGIHFLPDWRRHPVYREKLRHSLLNGGTYVMTPTVTPSGEQSRWFKLATPEDVEIRDLSGMVDVIPVIRVG